MPTDPIDKGVKIVAAVLLAAVLAWVGWKLFFAERAAERKTERVRTESTARVGTAQTQAGQRAVEVVAGNGAKETVIRETTRNNYYEITKQPGAGDPVSGAVDLAGRRAICLRASAAGLPECQRLQKASHR
jgi:hypothetical protein